MSILKIAITGPESSGKSTLAKTLADRHQTIYAPEFAREYLTKTDGEYQLSNLVEIAKGQLKNAKRALESAQRICFFDTDMLVLKIWAEFRYGEVPDFIENAFRESDIDGYLLCSPDIPWEPDPFRESPDPKERWELFEIYRKELSSIKIPVCVISGKGENRLRKASQFIESLRDSEGN